MKLVTVAEMRSIEQRANEDGYPFATMMERAGAALAAVVQQRAPRASRILVLAGPGNNGGDGLVAARLLAQGGFAVQVCLWQRQGLESDDLYAQATSAGAKFFQWTDATALNRLNEAVEHSDVIVDALLGTGFHGSLRNGADALLLAVQTALTRRRTLAAPLLQPVEPGADCPDEAAPAPRPLVVAADLPSGMEADSGAIAEQALVADVSVAFGFAKRGHLRQPGVDAVGQLIVADIGVSPNYASAVATAVTTPAEVKECLPPRRSDAHKGTHGKVLVIAGSANYVGAPGLAARAAYRSGAGLVTLAIPAALQAPLASQLPEATYVAMPSDMGVIAPQAMSVLAQTLPGYSVMLLGPGLSQEKPARGFVEALLQHERQGARTTLGFLHQPPAEPASLELPPTVIDADGLNILAQIPNWSTLLPENTVLTPHPGEMARLMGDAPWAQESDRVEQARIAAEQWGCTVVLKGAFTVVASPGEVTQVIPFAEPALATAGTGDVLAGTIAGLIAQGLKGHAAAACGAYLHGLAGRIWAQAHGSAGLLAGELADLLPTARQRVLQA
ncbi:MAG: NAD(P)H-hydrate dehydratase [Anaerolineae bacterium]|nr:NAD(P)H-hydrate dehydratase [Chloroflexota bacterium]